MQTFAEGLGFPEAPLFLPDGSFLCVEMSPDKGCVSQLDAQGRLLRHFEKTGRPNGLARDRSGAIWVAETAQRALLRMDLEGRSEVIATSAAGEPFLFLNDLAFAPGGELFLTDSGILLDEVVPNGELVPHWRDLPYDGRVYRIDTATRRVEILDRGFQFLNGVTFGPDGSLYVGETLTGNIYRYRAEQGRISGARELFGNVIENYDHAELKGPDGIKFGADGHLYACVFGQGDVTVLDGTGAVARRIPTQGALPTNLAFGPNGEKKIYVTEVSTGSVQVYDVDSAGLALYA